MQLANLKGYSIGLNLFSINSLLRVRVYDSLSLCYLTVTEWTKHVQQKIALDVKMVN